MSFHYLIESVKTRNEIEELMEKEDSVKWIRSILVTLALPCQLQRGHPGTSLSVTTNLRRNTIDRFC